MGCQGLGCEEARAASGVSVNPQGLFRAGCAKHTEAVTVWEHTCLSGEPDRAPGGLGEPSLHLRATRRF